MYRSVDHSNMCPMANEDCHRKDREREREIAAYTGYKNSIFKGSVVAYYRVTG